MKKYVKKKAGPKKGPNYRTPDHFKGSKPRTNLKRLDVVRGKFSGKGQVPPTKFSPGTFKVQHKG